MKIPSWQSLRSLFMSKSPTDLPSRQALLALSREELVAIILRYRSEGWQAPSTPAPGKYDIFYRQVAENFPNGAVAILDRDLKYVHVTGQELLLLGVTGEAFVGQPIGVITSQKEAQRIRENLQRVFQGESCSIETTLGDKTYLISAIPLVAENGSIDQLLAVSQNITEQHISWRKVQESEAQFRTLAENIPGAVYISTNDAERKIVYISGKIESLCGYTAEDFLKGRTNSRMLMHPDDQKLVKPALKEAIAHQQPYHFTYRWKHREGQYCWIEEYGANIIIDQKQYFQGVLFDVSEKKKYEKELQQQYRDSPIRRFLYRCPAIMDRAQQLDIQRNPLLLPPAGELLRSGCCYCRATAAYPHGRRQRHRHPAAALR